MGVFEYDCNVNSDGGGWGYRRGGWGREVIDGDGVWERINRGGGGFIWCGLVFRGKFDR